MVVDSKTAPSLLWGSAVTLALLFLHLLPVHGRRRPVGTIRFTWSLYLACHAVRSGLILSSRSYPLAEALLLATAGCSYIVLGVCIYYGGGHFPSSPLLDSSSGPISDAVTNPAANPAPNAREVTARRKAKSFLYLSIALACSLLLLVLFLLLFRNWKAITLIAYTLGVVLACVGVFYEIRMHKAGTIRMRRCLLFGTVMGCIDALLPLFFPSIPNIDFISRLLDALFYLPPFVYCLRRYDELCVCTEDVRYSRDGED